MYTFISICIHRHTDMDVYLDLDVYQYPDIYAFIYIYIYRASKTKNEYNSSLTQMSLCNAALSVSAQVQLYMSTNLELCMHI